MQKLTRTLSAELSPLVMIELVRSCVDNKWWGNCAVVYQTKERTEFQHEGGSVLGAKVWRKKQNQS